MKRLDSKMGWEIVKEDQPDFQGEIFKNRPKNVVDLLKNTIKTYPDKIGFIGRDRRLTFKEFNRLVDRIASALSKQGVKQGDHVALLLGIQLEFPLSFFALMKLGAIVVPLNTHFKGEELAYEINDSESRVLIVDEAFWPSIESWRGRLEAIEKIFFNGERAPEGTTPFSVLAEGEGHEFPRADTSESDDATIMYTSGTTGKPKGAVLHQRGFVITAMLVSDFIQFEPEDKMICCVPLFHITGLSCVMLAPIFSGVASVYMGQFKTKDFLEVMAEEKVTHYMGVVNVIWLMVNHPDFERYDFTSFRTALFGGSPAAEEMVRGIFAKLPHIEISVGYGLTECFAIVTSTPFEDALRKISAVGQCLPTVNAKIVDEEEKELPTGATGEILISGPKVFKRYWKRPEASKKTIVQGWVHTGDIGMIDDEGFIYVLDRKKDMINRGGEKIYSLEVENVICDNPKVLEVAVVGAPDPVMGEAVKACITLKSGERATEEELRDFCGERLADYKIPKFVEFLDSLPRNSAGKVSKSALRYVPDKVESS